MIGIICRLLPFTDTETKGQIVKVVVSCCLSKADVGSVNPRKGDSSWQPSLDFLNNYLFFPSL